MSHKEKSVEVPILDHGSRNIDLDHGRIELTKQIEAGVTTEGTWIEKIDANNGRTYWKHSGTGERTWIKPIALMSRKSKKLQRQGQKEEKAPGR